LIADRYQQMRELLAKATQQEGIVGASLITRDGLSVMNTNESVGAPETFSAMSAALMGAAETAFYELGGSGEIRVTAEAEKHKMVALGASRDMLLVVVGNRGTDTRTLLGHAENIATKLRAILNGG
jgi:predicted regulator of Ras-like GTPase activity (Roadblock/LC7/MglB family)